MLFYRDFYVILNIIEISKNKYVITYKQQLQPLQNIENSQFLDRFQREERQRRQKQRFSNTAIHLAVAIT